MNTETTFTMQDLIDFMKGDKYTLSAEQVARFISQFAKENGENVGLYLEDNLIQEWNEAHGY